MASGINDGSVLYFTGELIFKVALIEVATKQFFCIHKSKHYYCFKILYTKYQSIYMRIQSNLEADLPMAIVTCFLLARINCYYGGS